MIQLGLPMLTFVMACIVMNSYIQWMIPHKESRKKFKHQNEFYITLAYVFAPLLMLQGELIFLQNSSVTYNELNIFIILFMVKITMLILAGQNVETLFRNLKSFKPYRNYKGTK